MNVLDRVEDSLQRFHPKNHRQFIVYNVARQFGDLGNLARYLNVAERHPKRVLTEAARLARLRSTEDGRSAAVWYHELLDTWAQKEAA